MNVTPGHPSALSGTGGQAGQGGQGGQSGQGGQGGQSGQAGQSSRARIRALPAVLVVGLGLILGGGALAPSVSADSASDRKHTLDRQLEDLREALEGTSKSLVDAAVNLKRAQSELVAANAKLHGARAALAEAATRDRALAGRLAVAEAAAAKAGRELESRRQLEADTRGRLGSLAREAYVSSGLSGLSIALNAESPAQFADRVNVAGTALRQQNSAISRIEVQQADTRARQSRLAAAQSEVEELKRQSEMLLSRRKKAEADAAAAATEVSDLVALKARSVQIITARKSAERKRIAALQVQQNRLAKLLRARAKARAGADRRLAGRGGRTTESNGSGRLSYPVSAPITSGYGYRYHPILHYSRLHAGTDFGAACGTPVRAAAPGTIVQAGGAGGYGNQIVIDHGSMRGRQVATSYNHLSRFVARSGTVQRGQLIGYSGTTGLSTGCHLHFEVYVSGTHVNPMSWL
jgi:murein DD-endopeptidase MepM/ murein hydrolase activator NlpD